MVSHRSRRCQTLCRFLFSENSARIHLGPLAITSEQLLSCLALAREALPTLEQYSPFRKGWERRRRRQSCWLPPSPLLPTPRHIFFGFRSALEAPLLVWGAGQDPTAGHGARSSLLERRPQNVISDRAGLHGLKEGACSALCPESTTSDRGTAPALLPEGALHLLLELQGSQTRLLLPEMFNWKAETGYPAPLLAPTRGEPGWGWGWAQSCLRGLPGGWDEFLLFF